MILRTQADAERGLKRNTPLKYKRGTNSNMSSQTVKLPFCLTCFTVTSYDKTVSYGAFREGAANNCIWCTLFKETISTFTPNANHSTRWKLKDGILKANDNSNGFEFYVLEGIYPFNSY